MLSIDESGFDDFDRRYLQCIIEDFNGGPVGIESLAASLSVDKAESPRDKQYPF